MALERRNPLPVGRYWIDVFDANIDPFQKWLQSNRDRLTVESSRDFSTPGQPLRWWVLFSVRAPLAFDARTFGFPTIATADVKTSSDTASNAPSTATDDLDAVVDFAYDKANAMKEAVSDFALPFGLSVGSALALAVAVYLFARPSRNR